MITEDRGGVNSLIGKPMRNRLATRKRMLEAAYELFYRHGYARVSVDQIGDRAGVTKRTLYDHFRSKDELLAAVLEFQHEIALAYFQQWKLDETQDIAEMIDHLFADLARWSASRRFTATGFTRIVMELADLPGHPARKIASRHKAAPRELVRARVRASRDQISRDARTRDRASYRRCDCVDACSRKSRLRRRRRRSS